MQQNTINCTHYFSTFQILFTFLMWRFFSTWKSVMWRISRPDNLLYGQISPHDNFFLHGHRPWCPWQIWGMFAHFKSWLKTFQWAGVSEKKAITKLSSPCSGERDISQPNVDTLIAFVWLSLEPRAIIYITDPFLHVHCPGTVQLCCEAASLFRTTRKVFFCPSYSPPINQQWPVKDERYCAEIATADYINFWVSTMPNSPRDCFQPIISTRSRFLLLQLSFWIRENYFGMILSLLLNPRELFLDDLSFRWL